MRLAMIDRFVLIPHLVDALRNVSKEAVGTQRIKRKKQVSVGLLPTASFDHASLRCLGEKVPVVEGPSDLRYHVSHLVFGGIRSGSRDETFRGSAKCGSY